MTFVRRAEWGAKPPKDQPLLIPGRFRYGTVFHWNGPPLRLKNRSHDACVAALQAIQKYHQGKWADLAYSWPFCNHGVIFEGRGATWNQFANGTDDVGPSQGSDRVWYTAFWLGGIGETPSAEAYQAALEIVELGRSNGAGDRVLPHSEFKHKDCPGPQLRSLASLWDGRPRISPNGLYVPPVASQGNPIKRRIKMFQFGDGTPMVWLWDGEKVVSLAGLGEASNRLHNSGVAPHIGQFDNALEAREFAKRLANPDNDKA